MNEREKKWVSSAPVLQLGKLRSGAWSLLHSLLSLHRSSIFSVHAAPFFLGLTAFGTMMEGRLHGKPPFFKLENKPSDTLFFWGWGEAALCSLSDLSSWTKD